MRCGLFVSGYIFSTIPSIDLTVLRLLEIILNSVCKTFKLFTMKLLKMCSLAYTYHC